MPKRTVDLSAPYQTIENASRLTGLSRDYIRRGVRAGTIPFVRAGGGNSPYLVNVPLYLEMLDAESRANMRTEAT